MSDIFHYDSCRFLVSSDSRPGEFHMVELRKQKYDPTKPLGGDNQPILCQCERFTMGIPKLIKEGKLPNTVEHRRCRHIKRLREELAERLMDSIEQSAVESGVTCE